MNNGRIIAISILALLHTWFQDCSSRPLIPGHEHSLKISWPEYLLENPDPPPHYTYDDMALRSGPDSPKFSYTDLPQLYGYHQSASSSHDFDFKDLPNAYHHPSSSGTFSDHHYNLPSDHDMGKQHWNLQSGAHVDVHIPRTDSAWISTLAFPNRKKLDVLIEDDWGLETILQREFHLGKIEALKNVPTAKENLQWLLREIDTRNKQFLMLFTPTKGNHLEFFGILKKHPNYPLMKKENARLLEWFSLQIRALPKLKDQHGSTALVSFLEKLIEHLKIDWSRPELTVPHWQPQVRESKSTVDKGRTLLATASIAEASRTELALQPLEIYYKLFNPDKWSELFIRDEHFTETFTRMKSREHNGAARRWDPEKYSVLEPLPWDKPHRFHRDPDVLQILDDFRRAYVATKELKVKMSNVR
ncbi:hypothetical protein PCANC_01645 [Puccinia coronata f. sp. avenae]|uniref:Uncharacterized protein n=1 Tax=Puccinia coronata f. sp. avenae TaxID=200324 RepID=A0A2N5W3D3_9BASI|nr:hypothetical protein PCASD_00262 [Puccinia coronata f. sp. avenae]PLW56754.1 hypothetical protein PCANC_01645 [Puccinia coronata f. sp. avenae]